MAEAIPWPEKLKINPDDYDKSDELSGGTGGRVFRGIEMATGQEVVVKEVELDEFGEKYFDREVRLTSVMTHPTTLSLLGWARLDGDPPLGVLVTTWMANDTLEGVNNLFYKGSEPYEWDATARSKAVLGIVSGMAFMHSLHILHRDLKPANIFLDENYEVRIADFGKARFQFETSSTESSPSGAGGNLDWTVMPGTALYQAPECSQSHYTEKSDVYSFAVLLYAFWHEPDHLDDQPKRRLPTPEALMMRVEDGARFVRPSAISDAHWDLITECWQSNPEDRPSFADLVNRLKSDHGWVFEDSDEDALVEYEQKVAL
jgi:serine/threonine protein kinase